MKTIAQALKDEIHYPLPDGFIENQLLRRRLDCDCEITAEMLSDARFMGAVADCLYSLIEAPNISEADKSVSLPDLNAILTKVNSIYRLIGEPEKDDGSPIVRFGW